MTQDELNKVTQDVIAELKKNGTNIADASVVSDISQVNNLVAYGKNGKVIKVTPQTIQESVVKHVAWNDSSRLNDFTTAGVYEITGERKMSREYDNLPIENRGSGHTISARLEVLDSSINTTTNSDDKCITQKLTLSNRVGGDGNVYIRTGRGRTYDSITWEKWGTLQTNINVGQVGSLDEFVDNGIYSGVWTDGSSFAQTFVMVVINDYAIAGANKTIVQYKYAYDTLKGNGEPTYNTRSLHNGEWSKWEDTHDDDLSVLKEELLTAININKENIANNGIAIGEEEYRAIGAEETLRKNIDNTNNIVGIEEKESLTVEIGAVLKDGSTYSTNNSAYTNAFEGGDIAITNNDYYIFNARKVSSDGVAEMILVKSKRLRTEKGYTYQLNISKDVFGDFSDDELENIVRLYNYDGGDTSELEQKIEEHATNIQYLFEEAVKFDTFEVEELGDGIGINYDGFSGHGSSIEIPFATEKNAGVMSAEDKRTLSNALKTTTEETSVEKEQIDITDDNDKLIIRITPDGVFKENKRMTQLYGLITAGSWCKADGTITTSSLISYTEYNVEKSNNVIIKTVIRPSNGIPLYVGYKDGVKVKHYTPPTTGPSVLPIIELVDCSDIDTIKVNWIISSGAQVYIPQDNTLNKVNASINDSVGLFIGDSLMQGVGALIGYDAVSYVGKYLGIKTLNAGIGGTTMHKDDRDANLYEIVESYKNKDFSKPISFINSALSGDFKNEVLSRYEVIANTPIDIISFIFINYGANDWKATGTVLDNDENKEDVTTVLGSLRYAVRTFIELNPYIQILVSTPGYRTAEEDTPEVNGISMGAFCDAIEKACGELHIPCWNQYRHNGVNRYNADLYLSDGTHRTAYGYAALGKQYANFISNNLVKIEI